MKIKDTKTKILAGYGILMGYCFLALSLISLLRQNTYTFSYSLISLCFFSAAAMCPPAMEPLHAVWMGLGHALNWMNTRLILCLIFYVLFFPIGIIMRIFGYDPLNRKLEKDKPTYWQERKKAVSGLKQYEKQF